MPSSDRFEERDPTWNPPNPDPDPIKEGCLLQERLDAETEAVLEQADRGWGASVVLPKCWALSDATERFAGVILVLLVGLAGASQLMWVQGSEVGAQILVYIGAFGGALALWSVQVLMQRRVYGRRRSRAERKSAARERVFKQWQSDPKSNERP